MALHAAQSPRAALRSLSTPQHLPLLHVSSFRSACRPVRCSAAPSMGQKTIHLLRHGQTEMNAYLSKHEDNPDFKDPKFFDTVLTNQGKQEAEGARRQAASLEPPPQVLLASPLTRALQTAELAFEDYKGRRIAVGLARERTYFASDVGKPKSTLEKKWPNWSFEDVKEEVWWLDHTDHECDPQAIVPESDEHFHERIGRLKAYLLGREEPSIALVVHRDIIESMIGRSPGNCEFATIEL